MGQDAQCERLVELLDALEKATKGSEQSLKPSVGETLGSEAQNGGRDKPAATKRDAREQGGAKRPEITARY
jgi:hypothetical protein